MPWKMHGCYSSTLSAVILFYMSFFDVLVETNEYLQAEPDVQIFSIAHLTTIAIMDGLVESLVYKYLSEMRLSSPRTGPGFRSLPSGSCTSRRKVRRLEKKARDEADGVLCDIQALVGITDVVSTTLIDCLQNFSCFIQAQLQECRAWIEGLY